MRSGAGNAKRQGTAPWRANRDHGPPRAVVFLIVWALVLAGCSDDDGDQAGMARSETQSTVAGSAANDESEPVATTVNAGSANAGVDDAAADGTADDAAAGGTATSETEAEEDEEQAPVVEGIVVEIVEPDGTTPVERTGNTVRATVSGWEDREAPLWLVVVTPGDRHYPLRTFLTADGVAIWTEVFIGSDTQDGADFSLAVVSAEAGSLGDAELQELFEERLGTTGLLAMPGIEEHARQDIVRSG